MAELREGPALLSNKSIKKLGLVIDTEKDRSFSRTLDSEIPIRLSTQGHYLLGLLGEMRADDGVDAELNMEVQHSPDAGSAVEVDDNETNQQRIAESNEWTRASTRAREREMGLKDSSSEEDINEVM